jgi:preprotein translocase subunit SecA
MESTARDVKAARIILPSYPGDPHHVFLLLPHLPNVDPTEYREVRRNLLDIYCRVIKLRWPDALDIVGIATGTEPYRSEDAAYFDARFWTAEQEAEAKQLQQDLGILRDVNQTVSDVVWEYPLRKAGDVHPTSAIGRPMKGRERNSPCPCGSGRKYKRCCGA